MTLSEQQQIGVFMVLKELAGRGAGSLEEMRRIRTLKRRVRPEEAQPMGDKVRLSVDGEKEVSLSEEEIRLLEEGVRFVDEQYQREEKRIPEWLAAADEVARPSSSDQDCPGV